MKLYLSKKFSSASFAGEIIASAIIILIVLLINFIYSKEKNKKNVLIGLGLISAVFAGQGIANSISRGVQVYGILPSAIMSSFFHGEFSLLGSIIGAQAIGTIVGVILYCPFKLIFPSPKNKLEPQKELSLLQFCFKELIAQMLLMIFILYIANATFNNGSTSIDISPLITNLISLVALVTLIFVFNNYGEFMISPFISIAILFFTKTNNWKKSLIEYTIQAITFTALALIVGFIFIATSWWN